jgi:hypothetical protein
MAARQSPRLRSSAQTSSAALASSSAVTTPKQSRITDFVSARKSRLQPALQAKKPINSESQTPQTPTSRKRQLAEIRSLTAEPASLALNTSAAKPRNLIGELEIVSNAAAKQDRPNDSTKAVEEEKSGEEAIKPATFLLDEEAAEPAYKRYAHLIPEEIEACPPAVVAVDLTQSTEDSVESASKDTLHEAKFLPWLPLHERFGIFERIVFNLDSLCVLAAGRSQPCVYHKVQRSLENVLGRKIPIEYLERIKTVWPEAYEHRYTTVILQGRRTPSSAVSISQLSTEENASTARLLADRREEMKARVQEHVIRAHLKFITEKLSMPRPPEGAVVRAWHPDFNQELIEDIACTPLFPKDEEPGKATPLVPLEIAEIVRSTESSPAAKAATNGDEAVCEEAGMDRSEKSMSLLERIRAKERKMQTSRLFAPSVLDAEAAREAAILAQMDKFAQSVSFTFASAKKTTIFLADLTSKLMQSSTAALSLAEVLERLRLLQRACPSWIAIVESDGSASPDVVKLLDRSTSLRQILDNLAAYSKRLHSSA